MESTGGEGQFGQNGQIVHENDKSSIFGSKQLEEKSIFWIVFWISSFEIRNVKVCQSQIATRTHKKLGLVNRL